MALKMTRYSDVSQKLIPEGEGVRIRIEFLDGRTIARAADMTKDELEELLPFAKDVQERPARQTRENPRDRAQRTPRKRPEGDPEGSP